MPARPVHDRTWHRVSSLVAMTMSVAVLAVACGSNDAPEQTTPTTSAAPLDPVVAAQTRVDDIWTVELTKALQAMQTALEVPPTGQVDAATVAAFQQKKTDLATPATPVTETATETAIATEAIATETATATETAQTISAKETETVTVTATPEPTEPTGIPEATDTTKPAEG